MPLIELKLYLLLDSSGGLLTIGGRNSFSFFIRIISSDIIGFTQIKSIINSFKIIWLDECIGNLLQTISSLDLLLLLAFLVFMDFLDFLDSLKRLSLHLLLPLLLLLIRVRVRRHRTLVP